MMKTQDGFKPFFQVHNPNERFMRTDAFGGFKASPTQSWNNSKKLSPELLGRK